MHHHLAPSIRVGLSLTAVLLATMNLPMQARAQKPAAPAASAGTPVPQWHAAEVCKRDSDTAQCVLLEQNAERTVSGSWIFLPDAVRARCLADSSKPEAQSWRLLSGCIETAMSRDNDRMAVLTSHTPTEPLPPRKQAPVTVPAKPDGFIVVPETSALPLPPAISAPAPGQKN